jgi:CheY-like chemotaxis protein
MDLQMPVMDGLTSSKKIRQTRLANATTVPIIAMTANAFKEDENACFAIGINGHIAKPLETSVFFSTIGKYLDKRQ